ncbi:MAG: Sensor histidine kinase ResE [Firmicutes bacterium]|nr:Sensor histidine kinase ResE [candidate division NPL-UPA2 bacterium]
MIKRSIYMQLVAMLIGIIFISNVLVMFTFVFTTERGMLSEMEDALWGLTTQLKSLHADGLLSSERIPLMVQTGYFRASVFSTLEEVRLSKLVQRFFRPEDLELLASGGQVLSSTYNRLTFRLPAVIVRLAGAGEGGYLFVHPNLGMLAANFRHVIVRMNIVSLVVGSVMVMIAGRYMVRPIRELSEATKQISRGNFKVTVLTKRRDEIGQLVDGFNSMAQELQSIELLRSDFVAAISHEFRTPLTSIKGFTKLIGETESAERRREYADIVAAEADRLAELSSGILLMSQLESGLGDISKQCFRLDEQLRKVIVLLETQWSAKRLDLAVDLAVVEYSANKDLLFQVWLNILDNAIKFSPAQGRVEVHLAAEKDAYTCVIRDFGSGIKSEHQPRVFEKFYKGDRARGTHGSGLGLSIAKRIVELHQGEVTLTSRHLSGTTITVKLPKQP